jgi:outer membrane protein assembly factor BamB
MFAAETAFIKQNYAYDPVTEDPYLLDYLRPTATGTGGAPEAVIGVGPVIVRLASVSRPALRLLAPVVRDELLARHGLSPPVPAPLPQVRWSFPTDGTVRDAPVVTGGGVYASSGGRVYALDASSGRPRWARTISDYVVSLQVVDGQVYVSDGRILHVFDARTGRPKWRYQGKRIEQFTVAEGRVVFCTREETVVLDASSGRRPWRSGRRDCLGNDSPVLGGGAVYVSAKEGVVHALDAATGRRRWSARSDADVTAAGKVVYVGTGSRVRALDAASGAERWSTAIGDSVVSAPAFAGTALYARDSTGILHALDARTGKERWTFPTDITNYPPPRVTVSGSRLYLVGPGGVHALDAASGTERWSTPMGSDVVSGPIAHADMVYVGAGDNTVHALDAVTGAPRWRLSIGRDTAISSVSAGGIVYASGSGNVYALGRLPP